MCGKFTQMATWPEVAAFSAPLSAPPPDTALLTSTPMRTAQVLSIGPDGARRLAPMRWGFGEDAGASRRPAHLHARAETADTRPAFADAFSRRRGLVLVQTFNEGETTASGATRQWVISAKDRRPIGLAVIWRSEASRTVPGPAFVMLTVPPNPLIATITDRMPAVISQQDWPVWLGETGASLPQIKGLLRPFAEDGAWDMSPQPPSQTYPASADKRQLDLF